MKKLIIFTRNGEFHYTLSPVCFAENFTGNMDETCQRFIMHDMFEYGTYPLYEKFEVQMPDYFTERDYLQHQIAWEFAVGLGGKAVYELNMVQLKKFFTLGERYQYLFNYLNKRKKNVFCASMLSQITEWLNGNTEHKQPLSEAQFAAASKYAKLWEAKGIANKIYWSRRG